MADYGLTISILCCFIGAIAQAVSFTNQKIHKYSGLGFSIASAFCVVSVLVSLKQGVAEVQFIEHVPWLDLYHIHYAVGIDGLNILFLLINAVIFPVVLLSEWREENGAQGRTGLILLTQGASFGAYLSQDLFLQFFFAFLSVIPVYLMISIFGGKDREEAAASLLSTTLIGKVLFFFAILIIYFSNEPHTFLLSEIDKTSIANAKILFLGHNLLVAPICFALIGVGFVFTVRAWPMHIGTLKAAKAGPYSALILLSAVLFPGSIYVALKILGTVFFETFRKNLDIIFWLGVTNLLAGGVLVFREIKTISQISVWSLFAIGMVLIGLSSFVTQGWVGSMYYLVSFCFGITGIILFASTLASRMPDIDCGSNIVAFSPLLTLVVLGSLGALLGLPSTSGFVGQSLLMMGVFNERSWVAIVFALVWVVAVVHILGSFRKVLFGSTPITDKKMQPIQMYEVLFLIPPVLSIFILGILPRPFIEWIRATVQLMVGR